MTQIIAIPTFNRLAQLRACLTCLGAAEGLSEWQVRIFDDASTDYDIASVIKEHALPCEVFRNPTNLGCDTNNVALLRALLATGAKRVFLLDSDMIVARDVLSFIDRTFARTDGFLGVYNSILHPDGTEVDEDLVENPSFGGAATVWDADLLRELLAGIDDETYWDWQACRALKATGCRILIARDSRAQHIGIPGTNNLRFGELEFGTGFKVETLTQAAALADVFEALMLDQQRFLPRPRSSPLGRISLQSGWNKRLFGTRT